MLMTAITLSSLDKLSSLFGRYKGVFDTIRRLLIQAVFEDAEDIFRAEEQNGTSSTIEEFCAHETYFAALNRQQIQIREMQSNFESLRESLTEHKGKDVKRRSNMVAEMWKNAAVKSSAKMAKQQLSEQLKQAEQSLSTLHNSINIDTENSIIKLLDKLSPTEAANVLASLMPLVGKVEVGSALNQAMQQRQNFSSSDVLEIIMDLTTNALEAPEKVAVFPVTGKALPNSCVHSGVLQLLKAMKPKNRDLLIGELYGNDNEGLLSLLRLITHTEGSDIVELLRSLTQRIMGDDEDAILRLCGDLLNHAVGQNGKNPSDVMKKLFHHLPDEIEHAVHHESHSRRQETGMQLPHEIEAKKRADQALADAAALEAAHTVQAGMTAIETQTEDPNNIFGVLDEDSIWGGLLPGDGNGTGADNDVKNRHKVIELTHWYEDLVRLSQRTRYLAIAPMNFSKALNLVYDTYVRKIVKNKVDDRKPTMRESMGSFLRNSFKKLYGIPRVVNENLVGVVHSIELFEGRSRRIRLFGELCGRQQKEHISDRLSDVYLNMLTLIWPKFSKHVLRGKAEGECNINTTQIRKVMMGVFPKRHKFGHGKSSRAKKRKPKDFFVGELGVVLFCWCVAGARGSVD